MQCGEVFSEGSVLTQRVSLGGIDIRRGLFHFSSFDTIKRWPSPRMKGDRNKMDQDKIIAANDFTNG